MFALELCPLHLDADDTKTAYIGDDFPEVYAMSSYRRQVAMVVEETRSYPISGPDASERWATNSPKGFGYVRLGPEHRAFAISVFHQLHCIRHLRLALDGNYDPYTKGHAQHCLNYIRQ